MSRLKLLALSLLTGFVVSAGGLSVVSAESAIFDQACNSGEASSSSVCQDRETSQDPGDNTIYGPDGIITKIANIIAIIAGIAATIIIVIAGIQFMVSTGDPGKVSSARNAILYAVIGLVVIVLARTLVVFVVGKL